VDLTPLISFSIKIQTTLTILIPNCLSASFTTFELSLASMIRQAALVPRSTAKDGSVSVFFFMMSKEKRVLSTISRFIHINFTITSRSYP